MTRHVLDHPTHQAHSGELKRVAELERSNGAKGPHPTTASLQKRTSERSSNARMQAFMKIDRENSQS